MSVSLYREWLFEVWGNGDLVVADRLIHPDLIDHNRQPGQPAGRAGQLWAANAVRIAFPISVTNSMSLSRAAT